MQKGTLALIIFLSSHFACLSQRDTSFVENYKKKRIVLFSGSTAFIIGSLTFLNQQWYAPYNTGQFHFFNDNAEWLQMDKVGHSFDTYQSARLMMNAIEWAGYNKKQQIIFGAGIGFVYMTGIECMDGLSKGWGFSWGDELSNALGSGLAISQHILWNTQKINLKFSYSPSGLAQYNPSLLGKNQGTQITKDYNGQTYWLCFNPFSFTKKQNKFPKWLNLAFGYGANGMIGGRDNNILVFDKNGQALNFERYRQYYLSIDINLNKLNVKNKTLKTLFSLISILKFPAPTIEFNTKGTKFYYLFY